MVLTCVLCLIACPMCKYHDFLTRASFEAEIRCVQLQFLPKVQDLLRIDYGCQSQKLPKAIYTYMVGLDSIYASE